MSRHRCLPLPNSLPASKASCLPPKAATLRCKETGEEKTIVFGLTGTGYFDLVAYEQFNNKTMSDVIPTDEQIAESLAKLPKVPGLE